jgi:hypothetical protein
MATHQWVANLRHVEGAADPLQLLHAARCLDEDAVGPGTDVALAAAHSLIEIVDLARVGARENPCFRAKPLGASRTEFCLRQFHRHHLLTFHVAAALGPLLILDQDRAHAHALVALHRVHHVLDIPISVIAVHEHRQVASRHDVAHGGGDLAKALQANVRHPVSRADRREAADEIGLEPDLLDQSRAQRVVGARDNQKPPFFHGPVDDLPKTGLH